MELGTIVKDGTWIQIEYIGDSKSGKTKIYEVFGKTDDYPSLAVIRWHPTWRRYALFPRENTYWEIKCLLDIVYFLQDLQEKKK